MTLTNPNPKRNRDQKRIEQILVDGIELSKLAGQTLFALGMHTTEVATSPPRAAAKLLQVAGTFRVLAEGIEGLSHNITKWDKERLITKLAKEPIVGLDGQPLK